MYLLDVHLPGSLLSVCLFESLRSLRFKAERRAERVWNTLSLSTSTLWLYYTTLRTALLPYRSTPLGHGPPFVRRHRRRRRQSGRCWRRQRLRSQRTCRLSARRTTTPLVLSLPEAKSSCSEVAQKDFMLLLQHVAAGRASVRQRLHSLTY